MFGKPTEPAKFNPSTPPPASDVAKIQGGGLVQVIVTGVTPLEFHVFLNDKYVSQVEMDSLSASLEGPSDMLPNGVVRGTLSRNVTSVTGGHAQDRSELFPCTFEVIALGRRLSITTTQPNSLEGAFINLGLKSDGTSNELNGVKALRVLIGDGILDAKITWVDDVTEDIFPHA